MSKPQAETFAMGRFGTVVPCSTETHISGELVMLGRLIGTDDPRGRAEARGIVERAISDTTTLVAALRAVLPYARSRVEDMEEAVRGGEAIAPETVDVERNELAQARAAFEAAEAALAAAQGAPVPESPKPASPALEALRILLNQCEGMQKEATVYRGWFSIAAQVARDGIAAEGAR